MRVRSMMALGVGYVLGTRAGRERYDELVTAVRGVGQRLAENQEQGASTSTLSSVPGETEADDATGSSSN